MDWPTLEYSRKQVNRAGDVLCHEPPASVEYRDAMRVLTNWRVCHNYPINTFQATLRSRLQFVDSAAIVAQRLKRTPSIISKLQRFESMNLAQMQDIGGLRAVVGSLPKVRKLRKLYLESQFKHQLALHRDYIDEPKASGYRSIHLVYRYRNERVPAYDGLQIELQLRTQLQHAWATAVETMGTFLNYALKSSEGPERWLNFFALAGSAFAHLENTPLVPGFESMTKLQTFRATAREASQVNVREQLQAFSIAVQRITSDKQQGSYHLVVLDLGKRSVRIQSYGRPRLDQANEHYATVERRIAGGEPLQAVLVSTGPIETLRKAYPNYFLDTEGFVRHLDGIRSRAAAKRRPNRRTSRTRPKRTKS